MDFLKYVDSKQKIKKNFFSGNMNITILGCGKMGSAFAKILSKKGDLLLCSRNTASLEELGKSTGAKICSSSEKAYEFGDVILLGIKPKHLEDLSSSLKGVKSKPKILLSMLAGVNLAQLSKNFPNDDVVRIMPSLPIEISQGVIACSGKQNLEVNKKELIDGLLNDFGLIVWDNEKQLEAIMALACSGPAFVSYYIDAMISAGEKLGLSKKKSRELVFQTFYGTLSLLEFEKLEPKELMQNVASPGGCTIEGLNYKNKHKMKETIIQSILETFKKGSTT